VQSRQHHLAALQAMINGYSRHHDEIIDRECSSCGKGGKQSLRCAAQQMMTSAKAKDRRIIAAAKQVSIFYAFNTMASRHQFCIFLENIDLC
jgi:hypothetical protein